MQQTFREECQTNIHVLWYGHSWYTITQWCMLHLNFNSLSFVGRYHMVDACSVHLFVITTCALHLKSYYYSKTRFSLHLNLEKGWQLRMEQTLRAVIGKTKGNNWTEPCWLWQREDRGSNWTKVCWLWQGKTGGNNRVKPFWLWWGKTGGNQYHHHQSLNREGCLGTTDDFATTFLHFSLFSTALWDLPNSRPVHSLRLSSHLFLCRPSSPFHCALQDGFGQTWWTGNMTIPLQFASLYDCQEIFVWSSCLLDLGMDFRVGNMVFVWDV